MIKTIFCKECVYPINAVNLRIDADGICSSCKVHKTNLKIGGTYWKKREKQFKKILTDYKKKNKSSYDCVIPVSGGKDSYYQTHLITKKYGLKPLLVTYDGNNFLPEGIHNRNQMKKHFDADHIVWSPSVKVLRKMNKLAFIKMGDMNWQNHCGIFTAPIVVAEKFNIPLIIWGETSWDISGMFSSSDNVEFSARTRHEHDLRGFEWIDFSKEKKNRLSFKDFIWADYPSDEKILKVGIKGLYIGNFFQWDGKKNAELSIKKYKWKVAQKPFERTYRNYSNIDDRYENGVHDLMKFIKFGYGRCSDHASKDIRNKYISRKKGVSLVKKYDHIISKDLYHWLNYVNMKESTFWKIADTFRDPRVWWIKNNKWYKNNLWGGQNSYGKVYLNRKQIKEFNKRQKKILKN
jgi:N-acetyl sugar amidotransferase